MGSYSVTLQHTGDCRNPLGICIYQFLYTAQMTAVSFPWFCAPPSGYQVLESGTPSDSFCAGYIRVFLMVYICTIYLIHIYIFMYMCFLVLYMIMISIFSYSVLWRYMLDWWHQFKYRQTVNNNDFNFGQSCMGPFLLYPILPRSTEERGSFPFAV